MKPYLKEQKEKKKVISKACLFKTRSCCIPVWPLTFSGLGLLWDKPFAVSVCPLSFRVVTVKGCHPVFKDAVYLEAFLASYVDTRFLVLCSFCTLQGSKEYWVPHLCRNQSGLRAQGWTLLVSSLLTKCFLGRLCQKGNWLCKKGTSFIAFKARCFLPLFFSSHNWSYQ